MSIFDMFKKDPDVVAAEKRAYEKEAAQVKLEKKNTVMRNAAVRGKQKARGKSGGSSVEAKAAKVGKGILRVGGSLMKIGEYGAGLNWGNEPVQRQQPAAHKGKKGKKQVQQNPFAMPEFPF